MDKLINELLIRKESDNKDNKEKHSLVELPENPLLEQDRAVITGVEKGLEALKKKLGKYNTSK